MTTFGYEIECASPVNHDDVAQALRAAGIDAVTAAYSGRGYSRWQVKSDVTIPTSAGHRYQVEVVSPVLTWGTDEAVRQSRIVSEVLAGLDCRVLRPTSARMTAGLHVHVQLSDLSPSQMATWVRQWHAFQTTTDSLVRSGRQSGGNYSGWCRVLDAGQVDRFAEAARIGDVSGVTYAAADHGYAVNTQWWAERGTIEIRQRDGSVHWQKILGWAAYIMATKAHAYDGTVYTPTADYLTWLVDMDYLTAEHAQWALRNVDAVAAAERVTTEAQSRLAGLRRLQGIS